MRRRSLLGAAAAAGVAGVAGCEPDPPRRPAATAPPLDPASWPSVRRQFALDPRVAHLAAFVFAPHPGPVRQAIEEHRAGLDADPIGYLHEHEVRLEEAVGYAAAAYLRTNVDQIAFTDSTTMGLGLLYGGLRLTPGDEVLTTEHDFYATHEALRLRSLRDGVAVRRVQLYADPATASVDEITGRLAAAVGPRTRVVAVTWVHSSTGVRLPVRQLADTLRQRSPRALLCVDGVHGFGAQDATPEQLGCDFLVTGCHKWLFGPRGTGLIWGSPRGWAAYTPVVPTFDRRVFAAVLGFAPQPVPPGPAATPGGYHSFEHRWALRQAFEFHTAIGAARVAARTTELATALKNGIAELPGIRLVTPRDPALSAGVVCCAVDGMSPETVVRRLDGAGVVASTTPYAPSYLRFGPSLVNDEDDLARVLAALRTR